jgi:maleate isomerase
MTQPAAARYSAHRHFIGTITPSGNTVVERITLGIVRELPDVSVHFSRTPVFGSSDPSPSAYAREGFLAAARLLAHATPQVLVWNGSKGAGIGFEHDRQLADAITAETGIRTTTSILGLAELLDARGIRRLGIVTPYATESQAKTLDCLAREGFECVAEAHAGLSDNLSYASVPTERIAAMAREVARSRPQAIVCLCTNFPAAVLAAPLEAELGLPVYDSTALGIWHALRLCGVNTRPAAPWWGSLFSEAV